MMALVTAGVTRRAAGRLLGRRREPQESVSPETPAELGGLLGHYDPPQLLFQLAEVVNERTYLRAGVEVERGDVVLDVGSNVGVAAAFFAAHCHAGVVHCFEPIPILFEQLVRNVSEFEACVPHRFGLGERDESVTMTFYPKAAAMSGVHADPARDREAVRTYMLNTGFGEAEADEELEGLHEGEQVRVHQRRLSGVIDELGLDRVDLLKVDVERAERDVLNGIDEPHWKLIRQLVIEVHDEDGRLAQIRDGLGDRGYSVTVGQEGPWRGTPLHMVYARAA
jgi:FkbM family methyltransferase